MCVVGVDLQGQLPTEPREGQADGESGSFSLSWSAQEPRACRRFDLASWALGRRVFMNSGC